MYEARRQAFMEKMQGGLAIFKSAPIFERGRGIEYPYRQDSDFYYLTGFPEPEAICLLIPEHPEHRFVLFVRPRDPAQETWNGRRAGVEGAVLTYDADIAYTIDQFEKVIPRYLAEASKVYYNNGQSEAFDEDIVAYLKLSRSYRNPDPTALLNPGPLLDEMRQIKQAEEIALLRKAAEITAQAHCEAMKAARPKLYEYEIQALVEYIFRKNGAARNGYQTIIGSGPNSTILHYEENNRIMEDGELLLVDAGAEYQYYTADITRTFPVNGRFSAAQRAIYQIVLQAEIAAIEAIKPGATLSEAHDKAVDVIANGLVELGILTGDVKELIANESYRTFFMHSTSHWLGLDVWDRGVYRVNGQPRALEPGMVFTIEPGIYIPEGTEGVDPQYWNIGVRIEDNVLVTADGYEVLTSGVPKTIDEIEALMAAK